MIKYALAIYALMSFSASATTLSDLLESAESVDPAYQSAIKSKFAGEQNVSIARARLMPQLSAQSNLFKSSQDLIRNGQPSSFSGQSRNSQLNFRQSLLRPRDWYGLGVGELQAEYAVQQWQSNRSNLWYRTLVTWLDYSQATMSYALLSQYEQMSQRSVIENESRLKAGESTKDIYLQAKAQDNLFQVEINEAIINSAIKRDSLFMITQKYLDKNHLNLNLDKIRFNQLLAIKKELDSVYLTDNPEILSAQINTNIAEKKLKQAKSDHLPTVDLVANYIRSESDTVATLGASTTNRQVGISLSIPLFSGGGVTAVERQSVELYEAAKFDLAATKNKVSNQYLADSGQLEIAFKKMTSSKAVLAAAEAKKNAMDLGYKKGLRSYSELAFAVRDYARAKNSYQIVLLDYLRALIKLASNVDTEHAIWLKLIQELEYLK